MNVQAEGGKLPRKASCRRLTFVARIFVDGDRARWLATWAVDKAHITLEIIRRGAEAKAFELPPRRWLVKLTLAS